MFSFLLIVCTFYSLVYPQLSKKGKPLNRVLTKYFWILYFCLLCFDPIARKDQKGTSLIMDDDSNNAENAGNVTSEAQPH